MSSSRQLRWMPSSNGLKTFDPWGLAALHVMTGLSGSALLALAVALGRLTPEEAWAAAHVDEDWQIAQWGEDEEAKQRRGEPPPRLRRRRADARLHARSAAMSSAYALAFRLHQCPGRCGTPN